MIDPDRDTAFSRQILDVLSARTKASLHNVANQHVEGFKRYTVRFEDLVREATVIHRRPISAVSPAATRRSHLARQASKPMAS